MSVCGWGIDPMAMFIVGLFLQKAIPFPAPIQVPLCPYLRFKGTRNMQQILCQRIQFLTCRQVRPVGGHPSDLGKHMVQTTLHLCLRPEPFPCLLKACSAIRDDQIRSRYAPQQGRPSMAVFAASQVPAQRSLSVGSNQHDHLSCQIQPIYMDDRFPFFVNRR